MAGLTGKSISSAYKSLLRVDDDNNGIDTGATVITDGEGTKSALFLSDDTISVRPQNDDSIVTFGVRAKGGTSLLTVDTTNSVVKAGVGAFNVLTQYAHFGITDSQTGSFATGTHHPVPFYTNTHLLGSVQDNITFGTGTDPATSFTTAAGDGTNGSDLVPMMWYVPDNISIDAVYSLEGADNATGDTTRFHLMSYSFSSGSTSALTSGTLLAHSTDQVNSGSEQGYLNTWTVDSASVASGRVILAFFEYDSANANYSMSITVKYHLV